MLQALATELVVPTNHFGEAIQLERPLRAHQHEGRPFRRQWRRGEDVDVPKDLAIRVPDRAQELAELVDIDEIQHVDAVCREHLVKRLGELESGEMKRDRQVIEGVPEDHIKLRDALAASLATQQIGDVVAGVQIVTLNPQSPYRTLRLLVLIGLNYNK